MPKSITAELQDFESLSNVSDVQIVVGPLKRAFAARSSSTIAKAASLVAKFKVHALEYDMSTAFEHFLGAGARSDNLCSAKLAIVKALRAIHSEERGLYVLGMQHYWPSRPRPGQRDQAAGLRIACAEALADIGHIDLLMHLADLLGDPTPGVRVAAARALSSTGEREAKSLLRLKVRCGDAASEVTDACFAALLNHDAKSAIPFIGEFLAAEDEKLRILAALALGQSEHQDALDHLTACWKRLSTMDSRSDILVAVALLRYPRAVDFLLSLIDDGGEDAEGAVQALASFKADPQTRRKVESAVNRADEPSLRRCFEARFR
ncbi:MAG: HEAT repeat domain-containing protein [Paludisphaera borealis]|uniref:HEAT repeat domain-containing protein n=1 Tax=Paludisphaera borealis TaxID=1387353 RepID=UPI002846AEC2|nr:HEAT repeat domain-containing protein [Paludisphaera borealis]MDR3620678.1 HEAT repeat domain-containing protein [Paludisphaera borealis]